MLFRHRLPSVTAIVLAAFCASAGAQEAATDDPVARLLQERGIAPIVTDAAPTAAPSMGFAGTVRHAASDLVISSMNFLGVPYRRGGESADTGFDCSGFTRHVFEHTLGLVLPRRAADQAQNAGLQRIDREELRPGDLVFFNTLKAAFSHVGIYVGDGKFIHAPRTGGVVRVENMRIAYWTKRFDGARRIQQFADASSAQR
jgi:cell wall-associated NlpC family hydrolase